MEERIGKLFIYGRCPDARLKMSPKAAFSMGKSKWTFGKNGGVRMEIFPEAGLEKNLDKPFPAV
jgi:hypothetical protein